MKEEVHCANCRRLFTVRLPPGITGTFFCSFYCYNYWRIIQFKDMPIKKSIVDREGNELYVYLNRRGELMFRLEDSNGEESHIELDAEDAEELIAMIRAQTAREDYGVGEDERDE